MGRDLNLNVNVFILTHPGFSLKRLEAVEIAETITESLTIVIVLAALAATSCNYSPLDWNLYPWAFAT